MNKATNVLDYYYRACRLKEVERTGWREWNISSNGPVERIAEHIYGTQILAMAIYSEYELDLDINRVTTMLAHHETEEIEIGDITPFDGVSDEEKKRIGKVAVNKVTKLLANNKYIRKLISEFEEGNTKEAKFAYLCDKLECILWAERYSETRRISFENAPQSQIKEPRIQKIIADGAETVGEVFREFHKNKFISDEVFMEILEQLKSYKK